MNQKAIITEETIWEDRFSREHFLTNKLDDFMMLFAQILRFGISLQLISEEHCKMISNLIVAGIQDSIVIDEDTDEREERLVISNYLYVINLYLNAMSAWDAWLILKEIRTLQDAKDLAKEAKRFLLESLNPSRKLLIAYKESVFTLGIKNVNQYYDALYHYVNRLMAFDSVYQRFDVRTYHQMFFSFGLYTFIHEVDDLSKDLCTRVNEHVNSFCMEVQLMHLVETHQVISYQKQEILENHERRIEELERIDKKYEEKLSLLKDEYDRRLKDFIQSLHRPGRKKYGYTDELEIEEEYSQKKYQIEVEWENVTKRLKNANVTNENVFSLGRIAFYSLVDIVKEYALYAMALKGIITYPDTSAKRAQILETMDAQKAAKEFVENHNNILSKEQIAYLLDT